MNKTQFELRNNNGCIRGTIKQSLNESVGVVICLHGGPNGNLSGNEGIFDQIAEKIVPLNFIVVQFSFFGSIPSDGEQKDTTLYTQKIDFESVLDFATTNYKLPIHVIAESAGVTIAALNWMTKPRSYVLLWPAFDLKDTDLRGYFTKEWYEHVKMNGVINDNGLIIGGDYYIDILLTDFEPSFKLPENDILILHGQSDEEVPYSQSIKALSLARGYVKFVTLRSAGHGFKLPKHREIILKELFYWFSQY